MDDPVRLDGDASPSNPVGLFENATCEFEDVNLSVRRSDMAGKEATEPSDLAQYQRKMEKKMAEDEKTDVKIVNPDDNEGFQKGLDELAKASGLPEKRERQYIDKPPDKKNSDEDAFNNAL